MPTIRFRPRHDLWDAVDFYLLFLIGAQTGGLFLIAQGWGLLQTAALEFRPWFLLVVGFAQFVLGTATLVMRVWQRFAESYELAPTGFVVDYGYRVLRVPYADISGVHPNKICRMTAALKPALRVKFFRPVGGTRGLDVAVTNPDMFLDELAARCPHLQREGPRLAPAE